MDEGLNASDEFFMWVNGELGGELRRRLDEADRLVIGDPTKPPKVRGILGAIAAGEDPLG